VANGQESLKEWGPLQLTMHSHEGVSGLWLKVEGLGFRASFVAGGMSVLMPLKSCSEGMLLGGRISFFRRRGAEVEGRQGSGLSQFQL